MDGMPKLPMAAGMSISRAPSRMIVKYDIVVEWFISLRTQMTNRTGQSHQTTTMPDHPSTLWRPSCRVQIFGSGAYWAGWAVARPLSVPNGHASQTWFLGPTGVHNPKGISISSAIFTGLAIVSDMQTMLPIWLTTGHRKLYLLRKFTEDMPANSSFSMKTYVE